MRRVVDTDGTPLVEKTPNERLRLPPPSAPVGWHPVLGERIEGEWNDCWWEGVVREFHPLKGVLFQYDRYANWMWLPLHATRPRPPPYLFYPQRDELPEPEVEESSGPRAGICGLQGCQLPNNHLGLCQIRVEGTRRSSMKEKAELQNQEQLWQEIKSRRRRATTSTRRGRTRSSGPSRWAAIAPPAPPPAPLPPYPLRSSPPPSSSQAGAAIAAPWGNKSQWHKAFQLDEFMDAMRTVNVLHEVAGGGAPQLRGMLVLGPGHTRADVYHMLRTELQARGPPPHRTPLSPPPHRLTRPSPPAAAHAAIGQV